MQAASRSFPSRGDTSGGRREPRSNSWSVPYPGSSGWPGPRMGPSWPPRRRTTASSSGPEASRGGSMNQRGRPRGSASRRSLRTGRLSPSRARTPAAARPSFPSGMRLQGDAWRACRSMERSAPSIAGSWPEGGCWRLPGSTASGPFGSGTGAWRTRPALSCGERLERICAIESSPDGAVFVVADEAGPVTIRDSGTGDPLRVLPLAGEGAAGDRLLVRVGLGGEGVPGACRPGTGAPGHPRWPGRYPIRSSG